MAKETKVSQENDASMSQEDIDNNIREIDYEIVSSGPLYVDPRNKKPGYVYSFVADRPGELEMYKRWGYDVVTDETKVGDNTASTSTKFGSAVTVQSKCGTVLVLMGIRTELHEKLMAYRDKKSSERTKGLGRIENVPEQYQKLHGQDLGEYKIIK